MNKEELLKKHATIFYNLSNNSPTDEQYEKSKKFIEEVYHHAYKAGYDQGYMSYHMEQL